MRLHLSSASHYNPCKQSEQPCCLPLHASTSRGDILSHDNFVTVWGPFRRWFCHVRLFTLSHGDRTAGVVASSSRVRRWRVPLSLWSSSCLDRPHALCDSSKQAYMCSPEHTLPCLLHDEWLISAFIYFYLQVKILKIFPNLNLAIPFTVISLMSSAACSSTPIFRSHLLGVPNVTAARAYLRYVRLLCQNNNPSTEIIFWGKRKKSHGAKCCELVGWWETYPTQNAEVKEEF